MSVDSRMRDTVPPNRTRAAVLGVDLEFRRVDREQIDVFPDRTADSRRRGGAPLRQRCLVSLRALMDLELAPISVLISARKPQKQNSPPRAKPQKQNSPP